MSKLKHMMYFSNHGTFREFFLLAVIVPVVISTYWSYTVA